MSDEIQPHHYLAVLEELVSIRAAVARLEYQTVDLVRASGASWEEIGETLGISRQAAARKFGQPRRRLL